MVLLPRVLVTLTLIEFIRFPAYICNALSYGQETCMNFLKSHHTWFLCCANLCVFLPAYVMFILRTGNVHDFSDVMSYTWFLRSAKIYVFLPTHVMLYLMKRKHAWLLWRHAMYMICMFCEFISCEAYKCNDLSYRQGTCLTFLTWRQICYLHVLWIHTFSCQQM